MDLKGKKVVFLGDSITQGVGASSPETIYPEVFKKISGVSEIKNYGISGTRIARQYTPSAEPKYDKDFCSRVEELEESLLNPETRTLKQITVADIAKTDILFDQLMGTSAIPRKKYIEEHSDEAEVEI